MSKATYGELRSALDEAYILIGRLSADLAKARGIDITELAAEIVQWDLPERRHDPFESPTRSEQSLEGTGVNGLMPVGQEATSE